MISIALASRFNTDCRIGGDGKAVSDPGFSKFICEHGRISSGSENTGNGDRVNRSTGHPLDFLSTACIYN